MEEKKEKKSILIFAAYFFPHQGGYEQYVSAEAKGLVKKGYSVTIITSNTENAKEEDLWEGVKIYRLPCWHILNKTYPILKPNTAKKFLNRIAEEKKFNLINCHTRFFNTCLWAYNFSKKTNTKLLHIEHGTRHSSLPNKFLEWLVIFYDHTLGRKIIKKSWRVAGVSKAAEKFAKHIYQRETMTLYNSVDVDFFSKERVSEEIKEKLKKMLGIQKEEKIITFLSRLIYAKGAQDLIMQTKDMKEKEGRKEGIKQKIKIIIIGDGNYRKKLEELANGRSDIIFAGTKSREDVRNLLAITDIFVSPSYSEGLPTNVLEAGAMRNAIIATDVGGTREIIASEKEGILYDYKKPEQLKIALIQLLENEKGRKQKGKNIAERIRKKFNGKETIEKIAQLMEEA